MSHSAKVELRLEFSGETFRLAQVGPEWFILRSQCPRLTPGWGTLSITVDGNESRYRIFLPHGLIQLDTFGRTVPYIEARTDRR